MLAVIGHGDGLVDEQHRDAVLDAVGTPKTRVVQEFVVNQKQWPAVLRADEDAQQFVIEHDSRANRSAG
jgi:hypothetical protein